MSEEAAFLKAIEANPKDMATRLVYADWLEERGDSRGEFLRLEAEAQRIESRLQALRQRLDPHWLKVVSLHQLRYGLGHNLHCDLQLQSGRTIWLERLDQVMTYAGLLEGTPAREMND
jgi:uncharacterized protein (TIGR02996 family)